MYIGHVLILPVLIGGLLALHVTLIVARHHTQFETSKKHTERTIAGLPAFPGYLPRTLGLAGTWRF